MVEQTTQNTTRKSVEEAVRRNAEASHMYNASGDDAQKYAQASLNAANALAKLEEIEQWNKD